MNSLNLKSSWALLLFLYGLSVFLLGCNKSSADTDAESNLPSSTTQSHQNLSETDSNSQSISDNGTQKQVHTVQKIEIEKPSPIIPKVYLSQYHKQFCKIGVGDVFPEVKLPKINGGSTDLKSLYGKQATIVLVWKPDRWMAHMAIADIQREIAKKHSLENVSAVGLLIGRKNPKAQKTIKQTKADFVQLIDRDSQIFSLLGSSALPRIYVLDADGKIIWFDIEYSESTHRELLETIAIVTAK